MILKIIDQKIRNAFSDAAMQYDMLTSLHKEIGRELTKKIQYYDHCVHVLDVGMGTGWFTHRLTNIFPDGIIIGLDFASGMINCVKSEERTFKIVQADAAKLPFKDDSFDLITSNLAYQWVENLPQAFELCYSRLKASGALCLTMFGRETFHELFTTLGACRDRESNQNDLSIRRLADEKQVIKSLQDAGFNKADVSSELIKVRFPDMMGLIKWIKDIGANTLARDIYMGRDFLLRANDYYNAHFKDRLGVYATFEVIWVEANKWQEK